MALGALDHRGGSQAPVFKVPEPKPVKNCVHVDLASKDPEAEIDPVVELGASRVGVPGRVAWATTGPCCSIRMATSSASADCLVERW